MRRTGAIVAAGICAGALALPAAAGAERVDSALGIPCVRGQHQVQRCVGDISSRVRTWDGVPLDANVFVPPARINGPYPLVVGLHGYGQNKDLLTPQAIDLARRGYLVLAYTARGFWNSCGNAASRQATPRACARGGWIHLADTRYEVRDSQYLAGLLVDEGLARPRRVGVTGASYGGGQSLTLATLKDRVMMPGGRLVPWKSPEGTPMRIAAAAPAIGWSDLAYALAPNGATLDFRRQNPYGRTTGVAKESWLNTLYADGLATGRYAPSGQEPDITAWRRRILEGEPYGTPEVREILGQITRYHSAYYVEQGLPAPKRQQPAPLAIYNAWTDDLFPADEALRYFNRFERRGPHPRIGLVFANQFGHARATGAELSGFLDAANALFDHYLMDDDVRPPTGIRTYTQACGEASVEGPFQTDGWRAQHPGVVTFATRRGQSFDQDGGDPATAALVNPLTPGDSCRTADAERDPGAATYKLARAPDGGYTLLGSPTVIARTRISGDFPQIAARLWDVAPDGTQTLVARGLYRPPQRAAGSAARGRGSRHVFQLHPNGWHFAAGHRPKLELLGQDSPYGRASNGDFTVKVKRLRLALPVRDRPGGAVARYSPPRVR